MISVVSVGILALTASILALSLRRRNGEISLLLIIAASVMILLYVLSSASSVISAVNGIVSATRINTDYIVILLKVIGICLMTEFAANTCRDSGSLSLASNVTLAGKLLVTVTALPLYTEILNTVLSLLQR